MDRSATRAMWVWDTSIEESQDETKDLAEFCVVEGIRTVFYSVSGAPPERRESLASFASSMHSGGIEVHALFGDARWGLPGEHRRALDVARSIHAYDDEASPAEKLDGIQDDSEVYTLATWAFNPFGMLEGYLELMGRISRLSSGRLTLGAAVPCWFTDEVTGGGKCGGTGTLGERLLEVLDYVALMSYRDSAEGPDGTISMSLPFVEAAATAGKKAFVGQETQPGLVPPNISFHGMSEEYTRGEFAKIDAFFAGHPGYAGIAVHQYRSYRGLLGR